VLAAGLALTSSLIYGCSDFLGGMKSRSLPLLSVLLVSQGSALVVLVIVVAVVGGAPPGGEYILYAALAGLGEAVGLAALYRGLAVGVMSIVAPVAATAPVVPVVASIGLGELPSPGQSGGIALAVAGVVLISYSRSERSAAHAVGPSVMFGLLTAAGFGGFLVAMDAASEGDVAWALLVARLAAVIAFAVVFLARRQPLAVPRSEFPVLALIGVLIIAADALFAVATTKGLLSVVAVLGSLYPVVTIGLAWAFLHERIEPLQRLGAAVALSGAVAISVVPT
jgi:drug/metabolite transporter (DMT)-like permease